MSDLIERQAAIDAMCDASIPIVYKGKPSFVVDYVRVITDLPSVSTEKTGRWIKRENEFGLFECSVCKDGYIDQPTCMGKPMFKFCPSCGAKMGVEE